MAQQPPPPTSPELVAAARARLGMTQAELSELLGPSERTVKRWESRGSYPFVRYALAWLIQERYGWSDARELLEKQEELELG